MTSLVSLLTIRRVKRGASVAATHGGRLGDEVAQQGGEVAQFLDEGRAGERDVAALG